MTTTYVLNDAVVHV